MRVYYERLPHLPWVPHLHVHYISYLIYIGLSFSGQAIKITFLGPDPERPIRANQGLKFCSSFCIYLPLH